MTQVKDTTNLTQLLENAKPNRPLLAMLHLICEKLI